MTRVNISDRDFDQAIAGRTGLSAGATELARIMGQLNTACVRPMSPATEMKHLRAIQQANHTRHPSAVKTVPAAGLPPGVECLRRFARNLRHLGFVGLSGSTAVWAVVVALFLVTATGGLAAAGVLPDPVQSAVSQAAETVGIEVPRPNAKVQQVEMSDPVAPGSAGARPNDLAAHQAALQSAEQAIAAAEQAQKAAQEAAAISARCIEESMARVSALVDGILGTTSPAQAQALVAQAQSAGGTVKACADQAAAAGQAGVGHASEAERLALLAAQTAPGLPPAEQAAVEAARRAARTAGTSAGKALGMSQSIVDDVTDLATSLLNSTLVVQQTLTPGAPPPGATGTPAPPAPGRVTEATGWARWGMDYANQIMSSFERGAGRGR